MSNEALVNAARNLYAAGLNVLPARHKRPLLKTWGQYRSERFPLRDLIDALARPDANGIGIVAGPTSGGVYVRDFDAPGSFKRWAVTNPAFAASLPREQTGRGMHVFARWDGPVATHKLSDGELRGDGSFIMVAPSLHSNGRHYAWVRRFDRTDEVPLIDPVELSKPPLSDRESEDTETPTSSLSLCHDLSPVSVEEIIARTLPTRAGQRDAKLFELARMLKAHPEFANADASALEPVLRRWHMLALPTIGTPEWDDTWSKFLHGYPRVRVPYGTGVLAEAAITAFTPKSLAMIPPRYESEPARKLYALCRELQRRSGGDHFYLSFRAAAAVLAVNNNMAGQLLGRMVAERTLTITVAHTTTQARRYRFDSP